MADELIAGLRSNGHRITGARRAVCRVVAEAGSEHLTAADVHARVLREGTQVDQSTVYRTLEALEEAGLVRHGHLGHGPAVYHLSEEASHQHLVCSNCGRTVTIDGRQMSAITADIEDSTGFVVDVDHFALAGLCSDCTRT
jgi:Fur family ferric uptake transcriptional regulator